MKLMALVVTLTIHIGGGWQLDVSPQVAVPFPTHSIWGSSATTLPGVTLYDPTVTATASTPGMPNVPPDSVQNFAHEMMHVRQQLYLGPTFYAAYFLSNGNAFEPYLNHSDKRVIGWKDAWKAPTDMPAEIAQQNYPIFRVTANGVSFMPGYFGGP